METSVATQQTYVHWLTATTAASLALPLPTAGAATPDDATTPVPEADGRTHTVTFDKYSLLVDGSRVVLWSGEVHPVPAAEPVAVA